MSVSVNKELCIGCGTCVSLCPNNFKFGSDGKAEVINSNDIDCARNAAESCPVQAIIVE